MDEPNLQVPYIVYEGAQARQERTIKRLVIIIVLVICLLFASNAIWLYEWCQYDYSYEQVDVTSEGEGNASYVGRDINGGMNNGESKSYANEPDEEKPVIEK